MPAFGLAELPLPTNNRRMLPGCHAPTADALAADALADTGPAGSPLVVAAAAFAVFDALPTSPRV